MPVATNLVALIAAFEAAAQHDACVEVAGSGIAVNRSSPLHNGLGCPPGSKNSAGIPIPPGR